MRITWSPTLNQIKRMFNAAHTGMTRRVVLFSLESRGGIPRFKAKITRVRRNEYRITIGALCYDEQEFASTVDACGRMFGTNKNAFSLKSAKSLD